MKRYLAILLLLASAPAPAQTTIDLLRDQLRSPRTGRRIEAIRTLEGSGAPDVLSMLAPLVNDPEREVQLVAIDGLLTVCLAPAPNPRRASPFRPVNGSIADSVFASVPFDLLPRAIPQAVILNLLTATKDDEGGVRVAAALALGALASPAMGARTPDVERALVSELVYGLQHRDPATREAVVRAIGRIFDPPPRTSAPTAVGDAAIAALNDPDARVRLWASDTLGWLRERRAAPALAERFGFYRHGVEAEAALHALARIAQPQSADIFRQAMTARQPELRVMAVEGLGRLRDPAAAPAISGALASERQPTVLLAGAFSFFLLGERSNLDRLVLALADPALFRQAQVYLTELGAEAAPDVRPYLQRPDPVLRLRVAEVLGLSGDRDSLRVLEAAARDVDPAVSEAVRQALIRLRMLPAGVRVH
jgi:HEAT repeat protein